MSWKLSKAHASVVSMSEVSTTPAPAWLGLATFCDHRVLARQECGMWNEPVVILGRSLSQALTPMFA